MADERDQEKLALESIYSAEFLRIIDNEDLWSYQFRFVLSAKASTVVICTTELNDGYPAANAPVVSIKEAFGETQWLSESIKHEIQDSLLSIYLGAAGQVMIFDFVEWLREYLEMNWESHVSNHPELLPRAEEEAKQANQNNETSDAEIRNVKPLPKFEYEVFHSREPLIDRKSVFVAHCARVDSFEEVRAVLEHLKSNSKIARATHIVAYRIFLKRPQKQSKLNLTEDILLQDYDDDGETAAGSRLLKLLENCNCRNVVVIVSRWYGGVKLGPDRFKDINNVARDLLQTHGFINRPS